MTPSASRHLEEKLHRVENRLLWYRWLHGDTTTWQRAARGRENVGFFYFSSRGYFNSLRFAVLIFLYIASKTSLLEIFRRRRRAVTEKTETRKCDKCAELPWRGVGGAGLLKMAYKGAACEQMPFGESQTSAEVTYYGSIFKGRETIISVCNRTHNVSRCMLWPWKSRDNIQGGASPQKTFLSDQNRKLEMY